MESQLAKKRKALIVTGEDSGDLHGANLIRACRRLDPGLEFYGVGGKRMAAAGCDILIPSSELAVVGVVEVVSHLPTILKAFHRLKKLLVGGQAPDLLILIDFPEFNLRLAKAAKNQDLPVLYYVSPQIWAWRRGRIRKISRIVDKLAVILPFEVNLYKPYGLDAQYVGNPLVDDFKVTQSREEFRAAHDIGADVPLVGLFPGSRRSELRHIFPTIRQAAEKILAQKPECRFLLPVAPSLENVNLREYAGVDLHQIIYVEGENIYAAANACDAIVCVSGTVTLQIALTGTPMVIVYKLSPLTYWLGRLLIRVPFIGLANIVAGKQIAREFIQDMANPGNIASEILRILEEPKYNQEIRQAMGEIREKLGPGGCSERVARLASAMTQTRTSF